MGKKRTVVLALATGLALFVYLNNASWLEAGTPGRPTLLAHRGVHQTYDREGLKSDTCTASRITEPRHGYIENTLRSMTAAFENGADVIEIDVHPTTDGDFAVFHDWRLECRTNGKGVTREQPLSYLKTLDIGYGYTADGGKTHPLRGTGIGLMPSLSEVLDAFPGKRFLINIKSNDPSEADLLAGFLRERPRDEIQNLMVYGGEKPTRRLLGLVPELRGFTKDTVKTCYKTYLATGWLGYVPEACRRTVMLLPSNYAVFAWGWPQRFLARFREVGSQVYVVGPFDRDEPNGTPGIDDIQQLNELPRDFDGGIWTNTIELIGPELR